MWGGNMTKYCKCGHKKGEHWFGLSSWAKKRNSKVGIDKRFKKIIENDCCSCETCYENCCKLKPNVSQCHSFEEQKMKRVQDKYGRVCMVVVH